MRLDVVAMLPPVPELSPAKGKLYATALALFAERGFHAVPVRDIADALGQQPGAIYAHVTGKQHLLAELIRIGVTAHRDHLRGAVLAAHGGPTDQLRRLVHAHVLINLTYPELSRLISRELRSLDDADRAPVEAVLRETELTLADVIRHGQQAGVLGEVDVPLAVQAIGAMGVRAPEWWTSTAARTPQQVAETYADFALRLVR